MSEKQDTQSAKDWPIQSDLAREIIRKRGELHESYMAIWKSKGAVKTHLPAIAFDEYRELPSEVRMIYDPESHSILVDLPEPKTRDVQLVDFETPAGGNKPQTPK